MVGRFSEAVGGQLLRLCLHPHTGAVDGGWCLSEALRAALLVDLAEAGRLRPGNDTLLIDPTPTGLAPADALVEAWRSGADHSLAAAIEQTRPEPADLIAALVAEGVWTVKPGLLGREHGRYRDADPRVPSEHREVIKGVVSDGHAPTNPHDAVLAALAWATEIAWVRGSTPPPERLLHACGDLGWITGRVVGHLYGLAMTAAMKRDSAVVRLDAFGPSVPPI